MNPHNACIITFFMNNIDMKTVGLQRDVVEKFNKSKIPHYSIHTELNHGASMDMAWQLSGVDMATFKGHNVPKKFEHDVIMFLDVDALPLNVYAIDDYINIAAEGHLVGNVQRSNHIENNQHLFAAPSVVAVSKDTFIVMGRPCGMPTYRGDVGEEYTYAAEKAKVNVKLAMPMKFDEAPAECASWALKDGMPVYGRGTTFGLDVDAGPLGENMVPMFWHNFQSFHPGQQAKFVAKCEGLLNGK